VCPADKGISLEQPALKTVLVPLDGSPLAEFALPYVAAMAKEMKLEVVLVRAYSVPTEDHLLGGEEGYFADFEQLVATLKEDVKDYLDKRAQQLRVEGVERVSHKLLVGEAAGKIIDLARVTPDNLVAMCTHGRSGVGRWVLGSVTDRVIRHSGDPVLVIRSR